MKQLVFDLSDPIKCREYLKMKWPEVEYVDFENHRRVWIKSATNAELQAIAGELWEWQQLSEADKGKPQ